jgi:hypothetical protein
MLAAAVLGACAVEVEKHRVVNHTPGTIYIFMLTDNGENALGAVSPGLQQPLTFLDGRVCDTHEFVARDSAGADIASHTGPFCPDDTWIIEGPRSSEAADAPVAFADAD